MTTGFKSGDNRLWKNIRDILETFLKATHQDMSKFGNDRDAGYKRVVGVIEDFVIEAVKYGRPPKSVSVNGE
jgi:hypothetical protein